MVRKAKYIEVEMKSGNILGVTFSSKTKTKKIKKFFLEICSIHNPVTGEIIAFHNNCKEKEGED